MTRFGRTLGLLFALLLLSACAAAVSAPPAFTPLPTIPATLSPAAAQPAGLLVVVTNGIRTSDLQSGMEEGVLPQFAALAERGHFAALDPIEPTLPDAALVSLMSGQPPAAHGWVGLPDAPSWQPFWQDGACCTTALVGEWPGADTKMAEFGIAPGEPRVDSALHEPQLLPAQSWENAPPSFSPRLEATLPLRYRGEQIAEVHLLAVDTINDSTVDYDEYWLDLERRIRPASARIRVLDEGWGALCVDEAVGVEWYVLEGRADALRLYQSPVSVARLWPESMSDSLPPELQLYPADPDLHAFRQGWLDAAGLQAMARRQTTWLAAVTAWLWQRLPTERAPLVAVHWPAPGQVQAALLLVDPAQPGWQRPEQSSYVEARRQTLEATDEALGLLLSQVDLSRHTLFATSPLGVDPLRRALSVPLLLRAAGLDDAQFEVESRGEAAWLRPVAGAPDSLLGEAAEALRRATDPTTEQPLFAQVVAGEKIGGTVARGWLFVQAQTGLLLTAQREGEILRPSPQLAGSGGPTTSAELAGWWLAVGYRVRSSFGEEGQATLNHVSAAAAHLLGLTTPNEAEVLEDWFYEP